MSTTTATSGFTAYLESLVGSWEALAAPHPGARVVRGAGFTAVRVPRHPVLDNAVLLEPTALPAVRAVFAGLRRYAVWSADEQTGATLARAGLQRDETTVPMRRLLHDLPVPDDGPVVLDDVDPTVVADLNGVGPDLLAAVPGLRAFATQDGASGLVLIRVGRDVNVSFVATRAADRRRGLARAVLSRALHAARASGAATASLQATAVAERLYVRSGFTPVGTWQEWVPARPRVRRRTRSSAPPSTAGG